MTNQKTPVQGGATEEQIEAAARLLDPDAFELSAEEYLAAYGGAPDWSEQSQPWRQKRARSLASEVVSLVATPNREDKEALRRVLVLCDRQDAHIDSLGGGFPRQLDVTAIRAALSVSASADPADEHHDAAQKLRAEFGEYLGDSMYWCNRDHSAWGYGTMQLDDFELARDNEDIIESLVEIALGVHHDAEERKAEVEHNPWNCPAGKSAARCVLFCEHAGGPPNGEDHAATVTGDREKLIAEAQKAAWAEIHGQDPQRKYSVAEVKRIVYSLDNAIAAALVSPIGATAKDERERGFRKLEAVQGILAAAQSSMTDAARELSLATTALAAPVEVDEAKLAEVLRSHFQKFQNQCGGCGATFRPGDDLADHLSQVLAEWLRGEGR